MTLILFNLLRTAVFNSDQKLSIFCLFSEHNGHHFRLLYPLRLSVIITVVGTTTISLTSFKKVATNRRKHFDISSPFPIYLWYSVPVIFSTTKSLPLNSTIERALYRLIYNCKITFVTAFVCAALEYEWMVIYFRAWTVSEHRLRGSIFI